MKIADGLNMLEVPMNFLNTKGIINPTLIWDDETVILIDAGLPGQQQIFKDEITNAGVSFDKLNVIIITHQDMDHIGGLSGIQNELGEKVTVLAHTEEKPYIEFKKRPIKMTDEALSRIEAFMAAESGGNVKPLKETLPSLRSRVDDTLEDGQELPYCGGIKVIHTPGHTPGHICLYLKKHKTLVAGDLLNLVNGILYGPNPQHTQDIHMAHDSLKKLASYDIQKVICYHGGIYSDDVNTKIDELANA